MKIITTNKKYASQISRLMLFDLKNPDARFPNEMITQLREHTKEENILKELENPNTMAFLVVKNDKLVSFIVGYKKGINNAIIDYVSGNDIKIKKLLIKRFIKECKAKGMAHVKAETFEFMQNNQLFKEEEFILTKKEKMADNLEVLWYEIMFS